MTGAGIIAMLIAVLRGIQKNKEMGPLRFELRTSAMSRRRHSQLDHEPS